ncbi:hypothetical protein SAMD00019534_037280, partial [Acytostelium subglobosum LB1]|uniref:hypothetical protein n=1 Tax=Acytostelium subglobosum LB1 TaxID=1410327 RepID=UPI000644C5E6
TYVVGQDNDDVDMHYYDRQLYTISLEAMRLIVATDVLVVGLKGGLGIEIVKNIVLAGVRSVTLYDDDPVTMSDLSSNFTLDQSHVGVARSTACQEVVSSLKHNVTCYTGELTEDVIKRHHVVVLANQLPSINVKVNQWCRDHSIKFIAVECHGVFGSLFNDFGDQFHITDIRDEVLSPALITSFKRSDSAGSDSSSNNNNNNNNSTNGLFEEVEIHLEECTSYMHGLSVGDQIHLCIKGITQLVDHGPYTIKEIHQRYKLKIDMPSELTQILGSFTGGRVIPLPQSLTVDFKPLSITSQDLYCPSDDPAKSYNDIQLNLAFQAVHRFSEVHGHFPRAFNIVDAEEVLELAKVLATDINSQPSVDETLVLQISFTWSGELAPVSSIIGGVAAQEVLKAASHLFQPIYQLTYFDYSSVLPTDLLNMSSPLDTSTNSRYDGLLAVLGRDIQRLIESQRLFLVGAGASGCELLKNLALMGFGCGTNGHIQFADHDVVELHNLHTQILYSREDIGNLKATCAARTTKAINPAMNITAHTDQWNAEANSNFNQQFYTDLDAVLMAPDNLSARMHIDERCVKFGIPYIDTGLRGNKGSVQVVVPHQTQPYSATKDPFEHSFPKDMHHFPRGVEHTTNWAQDILQNQYVESPNDANEYLNDPSKIDDKSLSAFSMSSLLDRISEILLLEVIPTNIEQCIQLARNMFEQEFTIKTQRLLHSFPKDLVTATGAPFWGHPNRIDAPTPLSFSSQDHQHRQFVIVAAKLFALTFSIEWTLDAQCTEEQLTQWMDSVTLRRPKSLGTKPYTDERRLKREAKIRAKLSARSDQLKGLKLHIVKPQLGEPGHLTSEFVVLASQLKSRVYNIEQENAHKIRGIAKKIIPTLITSASVVAGLACLELLKLMQKKKLQQCPRSFINLATATFIHAQPLPPKKYNMIGSVEGEWTEWDHVEVYGDITLRELVHHIEHHYLCTLTMLCTGTWLLYARFMRKELHEKLFDQPIKQIIEDKSKQKIGDKVRFLDLDVCLDYLGTDYDCEDFPKIRYVIK